MSATSSKSLFRAISGKGKAPAAAESPANAITGMFRRLS